VKNVETDSKLKFEESSEKVLATPAVRRIAKENNVNCTFS